jgi:hypothetical protein
LVGVVGGGLRRCSVVGYIGLFCKFLKQVFEKFHNEHSPFYSVYSVVKERSVKTELASPITTLPSNFFTIQLLPFIGYSIALYRAILFLQYFLLEENSKN